MDDDPKGPEIDWDEYRLRIRGRWERRRYALIGFTIGLGGLLVLALRVFARSAYQEGDVRNEPWFVVGEAVCLLLIAGLAFYAALRAWRASFDDDPTS